MRRLFALLALAVSLAASPPRAHASHEDWHAKFDCERAAADADLILVARVEDVSKIVLMHGGKGESSVYQYQLRPLRVIKGIFTRDELVMSSGDLALDRLSGSSSAKPLSKGDVRLLFLGRGFDGYRNAVQSGQQIEAALPPLRDEHDPLVGAIDAPARRRRDP